MVNAELGIQVVEKSKKEVFYISLERLLDLFWYLDGSIGREVLKELRKKSLGEEENIEEEYEGWKDIGMPRNNILLKRIPIPKQVQQLNGCGFFCEISKGWQIYTRPNSFSDIWNFR